MRRLVVPIVMVLTVGSVSASAAASTLRVRVDANDSRSNLDIHKVITNLSPTTMYLRVRSWDRFNYLNMREEWDFTLDTFGSPDVYNLHHVPAGGEPGQRPAIRATRPDHRSAACHLPRSWFGHIDRAVRFRVFVFSVFTGNVSDKAPGHGGVYRWI
jgi:hypothetical protein